MSACLSVCLYVCQIPGVVAERRRRRGRWLERERKDKRM
jgi:hypothetical protein